MKNEVIHYEGGGVRESAMGKGTYRFTPTVALRRLSMRYQYGELKYGATDNFKKGLPVSNCWDSAMRHLVAYMDGDNSEDHLAAVAWNVFAMMEMEKSHPEMMDIEARQKIPSGKTTPEYYWKLAKEAVKKGGVK